MNKQDQRIRVLISRLALVALTTVLITQAFDGDLTPRVTASEQPGYQLIKGAPDRRIGPPVTKASGGPDAYGYRWIDSDATGGPSFSWTDISGVGTLLSLTDDSSVSLSLPFSFYFYGTSYAVVRISSNGYLTFGVSGSAWLNDTIPNPTDPDDIIAPFWDDLDPDVGGQVYYYYDAGADEFIVQYDAIVPHAPQSGEYTFQVIIRPNATISFQYAEMHGELASATIGIENSDGSTGLEVVYNAAYAHDDLRVDLWPIHEVPSNYSTIQAAISAAMGVGDTVLVASGTYTGAGNKDLTFDGKDIVLMSENGPESTIVDCEGSGRGIVFNNSEDSLAVVDGFTITNGSQVEGGGIYMTWSSPTITNCMFTGNTADVQGGGIYLTSSDPTISNCTFTWNKANFGGGLYMLSSDPKIRYCTFLQDTANSSGGGLYVSNSSSATISNCTFTQNVANGATSGDGGGMNINGSSPTISACTLSVNMAQDKGGGIHSWQSASPMITNCIITGNTAGSGGGGSSTAGATPTFTDCKFTGNWTAGSGGGGILTNFTMTITNCTIAENVSTGSGGGIKVDDGSPTVTNCTIAGNTAAVGGGIKTEQGSPTFADCSITGNLATVSGGGFYSSSTSTPTFAGCTLAGNRAGFRGGGIFADQDFVVSLTRSIVCGNCAGTAGDQIWVDAGDSLSFTCCDIDSSGIVNAGTISYVSDNLFTNPLFCNPLVCDSAATTGGDYTLAANSPCLATYSPCGQLIGALGDSCSARPLYVPSNFATIQLAINAANPGDTVLVANGTYTGPGNKDLDFGGKNIVLMSENGPEVTIIDCEGSGRGIAFTSGENNTSVVDGFTITNGDTSQGGGVLMTSSSAPTVKNCIIAGNRASSGTGGGIYMSGSGSPAITNCAIMGNTASSNNGGGIFVRDSKSPTIANCTIAGNTTAWHGGGIYMTEWCSPTITDCFVAGNSAGSDGGGIRTYDLSSPTFTNCTITGNTAKDGGGLHNRSSGSVNITNCTFSGNWAADHGGGIYQLATSTLPLVRSIVWGNCVDSVAAQVYVHTGSDDVSFTCSDVDSSGVGGDGMTTYDPNTIFTDPLLCNAAPCEIAPTVAGDYTLAANSPCLADSSPCVMLIGALEAGCEGRVFEVGDDKFYTRIQDAIDATVGPGDTVLVNDSTWTGARNTALDFDGREIVLKSKGGPATTIIDGEGTVQGIIFHRGESRAAILDGFTIRRGNSTAPGSAIHVDSSSSPTIRNCIISENKADSGVVWVDDGSPLFEYCILQDDTSTSSYGVLVVAGGAPVFDSCFVQNNAAADECVSLKAGAPSLTKCVVQNNTASKAVVISTTSAFTSSSIVDNDSIGMYFTPAPASTVSTCEISRNDGRGIVLEANSSVFISCDIKENMGGGALITGVGSTSQMAQGSAALDASNSVWENCAFMGNVNATSPGGGLQIVKPDETPLTPLTPTCINCTFAGNNAFSHGGGIAVCGRAVFADISPVIQNCTISANGAGGEGGGIYMGVTDFGVGTSTVTLDRTILWGNCTTGGNSGQAFVDSQNELTITCSDVSDEGITGPGVIYTENVTYGNPLFCDFPRSYYASECDTTHTTGGSFSIAEGSAAHPDSTVCGLIGAHAVVACQPTTVTEVKTLPVKTALWPCAPNPFNPVTYVRFDLAKQSYVELRIYDVKGRLVRTLAANTMPRGRHRLSWDGVNDRGQHVASGVYFLRMSAEEVVQTRKMVLLK